MLNTALIMEHNWPYILLWFRLVWFQIVSMFNAALIMGQNQFHTQVSFNVG